MCQNEILKEFSKNLQFLEKIVLGLDGKNFIKDAQKVEFQFSPQKWQKYSFLAA